MASSLRSKLAVLAAVVGLDDAWVRQVSERPGLAAEACHGVVVVDAAGRQQLDGYVAIELAVAGTKDGAHTTFAQLVEDLVPAGEQRHVGGGLTVGSRGIGAHRLVLARDDGEKCLGVTVHGRNTQSDSRPTLACFGGP